MIKKEDYIDGNKFESMADLGFGDKYTTQLPLDINKLIIFLKNFKEDRLPIIYVDSDRVKKFFTLIKEIKIPFKLLSHNGDTTFTPKEVLERPSCILKWYGQNIDSKNNNDIISLPIGLERSHWSKKRYGINAHKHNKIYEYSIKNHKKDKLLYINFNPNTNKIKRGWIIPYFNNKNWAPTRIGGIRGNIDHYLTDCIKSYFVLCPDGNGIDCHRNWEMLYMGVIPVIEKSYFHDKIYGDLPVLIVNDFKELTKELLEEKKSFYEKKYNREKLKFSYWENMIKNG